MLDSSKLKEFTEDNFRFDENGRKFLKWVENTEGRGEITHYVFKRLIQQTRKNQGLFWKVLTLSQTSPGFYVCCTSLLKTLREKEKLLVTSNFSFSHSVFYPFGELPAIFIKFNILVSKLFQFGRV